MNVIYMHTHDTGRYISPYGYDVPTPNLMDFTKEGTLFRKAFSAAPTCSPSRSALLTGLPPHQNGMIGLAHRGFRMHEMDKHIVRLMNDNGIETVLCGVQHVTHPDPSEIGYNRILSDKHYGADEENAKKAAKYIREKKSGSFFLSFGMSNTHRDWPKADSDINQNYVMPPHPIPDNVASRKDYASYLTSARRMDDCVGVLLDALSESGLEDETFIFFTTDHGLAYPNMKCNLYDTGIGVSLIIKYPGNRLKGCSSDSLVSHLDIFPTICDILDIEEPDYISGKSLVPLLDGSTNEIRDEIFAEVTYHAVYEPIRCIRTSRYKLIRYFDDCSYLPANVDGSEVKDFMAQSGFFERKHDRIMLFDLNLDPVERVNLVNDPSYSKILAELSKKLEDWMRETCDPLLDGPVEKPLGAITNIRSCYSPRTQDFE